MKRTFWCFMVWWGHLLVLSVPSTEATCEDMSVFVSIYTSQTLVLQSSIAPGRGCCSGRWGFSPLQGQAVGLPGEWRWVSSLDRRVAFCPHFVISLLFLTLTEYIERYGSSPVWANYRRNHKGGIPPQKTRKTCIVMFQFFVVVVLTTDHWC